MPIISDSPNKMAPQPAISSAITFQPHFQPRRWAHIERSLQMKTNHHVTSVAMTLALLVTSCMPVPPFTTPVSPEVTGRVLDAKNKKPIKGALIQTERAGYIRQAYTLDDGRFTVPSASQWHYLVYLGSPGFYPTPWMFNGSNKDLIMTFEASGYKSKSKVFYMKDQGWDVNLPESLETTLDPQ